MVPSLLMVVAGSLMGGDGPAPPARVGQIFILGNYLSGQSIILSHLPLFPGQVLTKADVRTAEQSLRRLSILGIGASVKVLYEKDADTVYKDIQVDVRETLITYLILGGPEFVCSLLRRH